MLDPILAAFSAALLFSALILAFRVLFPVPFERWQLAWKQLGSGLIGVLSLGVFIVTQNTSTKEQLRDIGRYR